MTAICEKCANCEMYEGDYGTNHRCKLPENERTDYITGTISYESCCILNPRGACTKFTPGGARWEGGIHPGVVSVTIAVTLAIIFIVPFLLLYLRG